MAYAKANVRCLVDCLQTHECVAVKYVGVGVGHYKITNIMANTWVYTRCCTPSLGDRDQLVKLFARAWYKLYSIVNLAIYKKFNHPNHYVNIYSNIFSITHSIPCTIECVSIEEERSTVDQMHM